MTTPVPPVVAIRDAIVDSKIVVSVTILLTPAQPIYQLGNQPRLVVGVLKPHRGFPNSGNSYVGPVVVVF